MTGNENRLGPDDLIGREFAIGLRGYDRDEVDAFLAQAAEAWRASLSSAPSTGLSSSAMAALAGAESPAPVDGLFGAPTASDPFAAPAPAPDPYAAASPAGDPFAAPVASDPFAAPAPAGDPYAAPSSAPLFESTPVTDPYAPVDPYAAADPYAPAIPAYEPASAPAPEPAPTPVEVQETRAEAERDRTTAYAERAAAELDRAAARTELAKAQEEALHIIDQAQRRAEVVLTGARDKARAEAETVLEDARSRLTPLLEQERAVRARLARLRSELDVIAGDVPAAPTTVTLPPAQDLVTATEDDPGTPDAPFPVGFGSVSFD